MNSKQIVAAVSVVVLLVIVVYPAVSTGSVVIRVSSIKPDNAEHVYVTINGIWAHQNGQSSFEGWKLVFNQTQTVDLVAQENSSITLPKGQLSVGSYDAIRIQMANVSWVFNKTVTNLTPEPSQLSVNLDFSELVGRDSSIMLVLSGGRQESGGANVFNGSLTAEVA